MQSYDFALHIQQEQWIFPFDKRPCSPLVHAATMSSPPIRLQMPIHSIYMAFFPVYNTTKELSMMIRTIKNSKLDLTEELKTVLLYDCKSMHLCQNRNTGEIYLSIAPSYPDHNNHGLCKIQDGSVTTFPITDILPQNGDVEVYTHIAHIGLRPLDLTE